MEMKNDNNNLNVYDEIVNKYPQLNFYSRNEVNIKSENGNPVNKNIVSSNASPRDDGKIFQ